MSYATVDDLVARFGAEEIEQLTDRGNPQQGAIVAAVADRALTDADALINRYLGARYAVPLTAPLPQDLVRVACDVARYFLHDHAPTETVIRHYQDALDWLDKIGTGKLPLIGANGALLTTLSRSFGPSVLRRYPANATFGDAFSEAWTR